MNVVSERLEARILRRRRNGVDRRRVAAKGVEAELRAFGIGAGGVIRDVPAGIDDDVLPAKTFQVLGHPLSIRADVGLADRFAVGIPTVPTHWRCSGPQRRRIGSGGPSHEDDCNRTNRNNQDEHARKTHWVAPRDGA